MPPQEDAAVDQQNNKRSSKSKAKNSKAPQSLPKAAAAAKNSKKGQKRSGSAKRAQPTKPEPLKEEVEVVPKRPRRGRPRKNVVKDENKDTKNSTKAEPEPKKEEPVKKETKKPAAKKKKTATKKKRGRKPKKKASAKNKAEPEPEEEVEPEPKVEDSVKPEKEELDREGREAIEVVDMEIDQAEKPSSENSNADKSSTETQIDEESAALVVLLSAEQESLATSASASPPSTSSFVRRSARRRKGVSRLFTAASKKQPTPKATKPKQSVAKTKAPPKSKAKKRGRPPSASPSMSPCESVSSGPAVVEVEMAPISLDGEGKVEEVDKGKETLGSAKKKMRIDTVCCQLAVRFLCVCACVHVSGLFDVHRSLFCR